MAFLSTYGIHGTNAPWTIGYAVSNGCVRMHEEDVEELFEMVRVGTPVTITHDTVKVRVDEDKVSVGIYPDIYGHGSATLQEVKRKLNLHGLGGWISDDQIQEMIWEQSEKQITISQFHKLKINNKTMVEPVISHNDILYIPVKPVATALNRDMAFDGSKKTVTVGAVTVPALAKGSGVYVTSDRLGQLFPGAVTVHGNKTVTVDLHTVSLNGAPLTSEVKMIGSMPALPAVTIASAIGYSPVWAQESQTLTVGGNIVPVRLIGNQPYLIITEIYQHFKIYVYWDQKESRIELTYPFNPISSAF